MNIYRITCFNGTISNLYQIYEYSMFWLFKHFKTISCVISFNTYLEVDVKYNYISIDIFLALHHNLSFQLNFSGLYNLTCVFQIHVRANISNSMQSGLQLEYWHIKVLIVNDLILIQTSRWTWSQQIDYKSTWVELN